MRRSGRPECEGDAFARPLPPPRLAARTVAVLLRRPARATLVTVTDRQTCGVTAVHGADDAAAVAVLRHAEAVGSGLWCKPAERRGRKTRV